MSLDSDFGYELEPERYELQNAQAKFELDRREFLRILGGGLLVLCIEREAPAQESGGSRRGGPGASTPREIGAWLHIAEDGVVTASTGKVEVGQNARTSLTQAVADELRVAPASVILVMGDTAKVPFDMGTFGSRTTPTMVPQLRRASAAARGLLSGLAAERWGVDGDSVEVGDGKVKHAGSGRSVSFGELTRGKKLIETIGEQTPITPPDRWEVAGRSIPKVNGRAFVTGRHRFASDITRPGMLRGKVLRPSSLGAKLVSMSAPTIPGVTVVRDGDFVGVVASDEASAVKGLSAISATWKASDEPPLSDRDLPVYFKDHPEPAASRFGGRSGQESGTVKEGFANAAVKVEAAYGIAYIAHAPLEPRAAVAEWDGDRLTVWTGTQRPFGVRSELARAFSMPEDRVRVIVPDTGSGYGGKHTGEAALEAARLARAVRKPVKLVWTREEEFTWAYFRPAGLIEAAAGAGQDGKLTAWEFHNYNSGTAGLATPYSIANVLTTFHPSHSPLRQGSYRALAATANHFARETLMDETAHALKMDPLDFRLRNLAEGRLRTVLEAAADRFGWRDGKVDKGRGIGIAVGTDKGGHVATCAEVAVDSETRRIKLVRVVTAFECGAIVNPEHLRNQVEGALVMGLGGALFEAIRFQNGKILNARLSRYRVPRFTDVPRIDVVLLDRKDLPSAGAGETPIVAIAPALGNALFNVTGVRLRSLPLVPEGWPSIP